ncbi:MFS family permease [Bacillus velezensis]|nr:MFS family permease [Bacillus velezensis]
MSRLYFFILVLLVSISGFSQGMLLPVISVIFETNGESAAINGLHATGLYIGVLLASPFMEAPLRKLGFKPLMVMGGFLVIISLFSFIWLQSIWLWFFLRLLIGIGDHMLHFSTQTWVTSKSTAPKQRKKHFAVRTVLRARIRCRPVHGPSCENKSVPSVYRIRLYQSCRLAVCICLT